MNFKNAFIQEKFLFFHKFMHAPKQIGSITPSSKYLCMKMIEHIEWDRVQCIAELGAGTGALTKQIAKYARKGTKVILFEKEPLLRERLELRFPEYPCYSNASQLKEVLDAEHIRQLDCIVSGLPFFNFPKALRNQLMEQIMLSLKPGGLFIAFQYSTQMKKQFAKHFTIENIDFVPLNIPPAFVYVCRKSNSEP